LKLCPSLSAPGFPHVVDVRIPEAVEVVNGAEEPLKVITVTVAFAKGITAAHRDASNNRQICIFAPPSWSAILGSPPASGGSAEQAYAQNGHGAGFRDRGRACDSLKNS
jgi:hypothetical protein